MYLNRWKHISSFDCATGKNVTPTVRGHFQLQDRGQVVDATLGKRASHGCIRV